MGDLFDDFMRELERRRAEAEGRAPRPRPGDEARRVGGDDPDPDDDDGRDDEEPTADQHAGSDDDGRATEEPTPIRPRTRPGGPRSRSHLLVFPHTDLALLARKLHAPPRVR